MTLNICPLCGLAVDDDESSRGVWTSPPSPSPETTHRTVDQYRRTAGYRSRETPYDNGDFSALGYSLDEAMAMLRAMEDNDLIEMKARDHVEKVETIGDPDGGMLVETTVDGKTGARVRVVPPDPPDPGEVLHAECYDALFGDQQ
jgi:hypothetical protein